MQRMLSCAPPTVLDACVCVCACDRPFKSVATRVVGILCGTTYLDLHFIVTSTQYLYEFQSKKQKEKDQNIIIHYFLRLISSIESLHE